jgi:hydrogenase/urease accessory protein HupE
MARPLALLAVLVVLAWPVALRAHGLDPVGVSVREDAAGEVTVALDRPATLAGGVALEVSLGTGCIAGAPAIVPDRAGRVVETRQFRCERPLTGRTVEVTGLEAAAQGAVVRVEEASGLVHRGVLTARSPRLAVQEPPGRAAVVASYLLLGAEHLARGADHLAFILGVALLARRVRRVALALTAFTVGHSVTLSATTLGLIRLPTAWAELAIAATLVWLAVEISRRPAHEATTSRLGVACGGVGLVHGLGFASALAEVGLPEQDVPLALFGFNAGIELAQLALVGAAFALARASTAVRRLDGDRLRPWVGHAIGAVAAMWCLERLVAL